MDRLAGIIVAAVGLIVAILSITGVMRGLTQPGIMFILLGGLIIGLAEQLGALYLPGQSPLLSVFIVFVLVLFLRPQGLFGRTS